VVDHAHSEYRGGEARDRTDGQVDLAEQEHEDDPDGDRAGNGDLENEVRKIARSQEMRVLKVEVGPDRRQANDDGERTELARNNPGTGVRNQHRGP
jgi:hypothetical protein